MQPASINGKPGPPDLPGHLLIRQDAVTLYVPGSAGACCLLDSTQSVETVRSHAEHGNEVERT